MKLNQLTKLLDRARAKPTIRKGKLYVEGRALPDSLMQACKEHEDSLRALATAREHRGKPYRASDQCPRSER